MTAAQKRACEAGYPSMCKPNCPSCLSRIKRFCAQLPIMEHDLRAAGFLVTAMHVRKAVQHIGYEAEELLAGLRARKPAKKKGKAKR